MTWEGVVGIVLACGLCVLVGWEACRTTHRERGIEVELKVPDHVPDDWIDERTRL